jgi:hypothetical protein
MALAARRRMALAAQREVGSMRDVISATVCVLFLLPKDPRQAMRARARSARIS